MSERPFEFEPLDLPDPPDVPGIVNVLESADEAIDLLLRDVLEAADEAVGERDRFDLAISGDPQLEPAWLRLMLDPDLRTFPWHATHLWFPSGCGDVEDTLIVPSGVDIERVHPILDTQAGLESQPFDAAVLAVAADGGVTDRLPIAAIERTTLLSILAIGAMGTAGLKTLDHDQTAPRIGRHQGKLRWYIG